MRAQKNRKNSGIASIWLALLLICLVMVTGALTSGLLARYGTASSGEVGARIARFDANAAKFDADISVIAVSATELSGVSTYEFRIAPNYTEVTTGYSIEVTLKNERGVTAWPAGLKLTVKNATTGNLIGSTTDGKHFYSTDDETQYSDGNLLDYIGIFYPGAAGNAVTYRLILQAGYTTIGGNYDMGLSVITEQLD